MSSTIIKGRGKCTDQNIFFNVEHNDDGAGQFRQFLSSTIIKERGSKRFHQYKMTNTVTMSHYSFHTFNMSSTVMKERGKCTRQYKMTNTVMTTQDNLRFLLLLKLKKSKTVGTVLRPQPVFVILY